MIKVASYCRVSTDKEDQANSFESQQRFFREYIGRHPDWELYEIYADEGITGTSTKKRAQFNRMINDAYCGRFRMIITKEVSRFSRNILDTIAYTRELKALGIGVIFMSDGFSTLDPDAELRLSIMGSIAQEESRKTSSRVKWGQTRQMERGVVFGKSMLGYDVEKGRLTVNPEGAEIVKLIFYKYGMEKKGTTLIARELREAGYKTYTGNTIWSNSHILKILKNEKYVGDLFQKKTITPDYLTHAKKSNRGEEEMVILHNHHEPIVSRELWNLVQEEIAKRNRKNHTVPGHSNRYVFSGKIKCGECGASFVSRVKTRKDGSTYRRWGCFTAAKDGKKKVDIQGNALGCDVGKQIRDDLATAMLKCVIQSLPVNSKWVLQNVTSLAVNAVTSGYAATDHPEKLKHQIEHIQEKKSNAIDAFLSGVLSKEELQQMKHCYDTQLESLHKRLKKATRENNTALLRCDVSSQAEAILTCKTVSDSYLKMLLDYMRIHKDGRVEIKLNQLSTVWTFQLEKRPNHPSSGCLFDPSVPMSVSKPLSSSKGME